MFQQIVERMTKERTDTFHDDHSSSRRRGTSVREKNVVGVGVLAPLHEERVFTHAKAGLHRELYQRDVTDGTLSPCNFLQSFQEVVKFACSLLLDWVYALLHGGRRPRCVVAGFLEKGLAAGAHAPSCSVIEYDRLSERRFSSTEVHSSFASVIRVDGCLSRCR